MSTSVDWRFTEDLSRFEELFKEKFADVLKEISKTYRFGEGVDGRKFILECNV